MHGPSSRFVLVAVCAWISMCLLVVGWIPEISGNISDIWLISGLMGLVSAVGLAEAIKSDIHKQQSLLQEYMEAAMTDGLTGLANRQSLDRTLAVALKRFNPERTRLSLIMIDIDHFKSFNDRFGHQAGDAVLRCMSDRMAEFFKDRGFPARYGGEEFAVMISGQGLDEADRLAEQFRQLMSETTCEFRDQQFGITISAGVTEARAGDTADSLLRRADLALYSAKKMGRDCIWVSVSDGEPGDADMLEKVAAMIPTEAPSSQTVGPASL
jgi:diguanylate cyclase (GGDEF)-like protein